MKAKKTKIIDINKLKGKSAKSPYSEKEIATITKMTTTILKAPAGATPKEVAGVVIVALVNNKTGSIEIKGSVRNISKANVLKIVIDSLGLDLTDALLAIASLKQLKK